MSIIEFVDVASSNLDQIGYDKEAQVMEVRFKGGSHYRYMGVPEYIYTELLEAESIGSAFNKVKKMFPYVRL